MEPRQIWLSSPTHFLAFGCGSGLARVAPGTFGTLAAVPLYLLMQALPLSLYLGITVALFGLGVVVCGRAARSLGVHDHPSIVWDEVVGFLFTMAAAPSHPWAVVVGFTAFRLFDILKPWPIRWVDLRVAGGFGIMVDDLLAAFPAWVAVQWVSRLLQPCA